MKKLFPFPEFFPDFIFFDEIFIKAIRIKEKIRKADVPIAVMYNGGVFISISLKRHPKEKISKFSPGDVEMRLIDRSLNRNSDCKGNPRNIFKKVK